MWWIVSCDSLISTTSVKGTGSNLCLNVIMSAYRIKLVYWKKRVHGVAWPASWTTMLSHSCAGTDFVLICVVSLSLRWWLTSYEAKYRIYTGYTWLRCRSSSIADHAVNEMDQMNEMFWLLGPHEPWLEPRFFIKTVCEHAKTAATFLILELAKWQIPSNISPINLN